MAREQFIDAAEDMRWLRDVHLHGLASKYKSAIIIGNEDWPERVIVFDKKKPRYDEPGVVFRPDERGKFHLTPDGLAPGGGGSRATASSRGRAVGGGAGAEEPERFKLKRMASERERGLLQEAARGFPATFGLRGFPGEVFRISEDSSYCGGKDNQTPYLYTERRQPDGSWRDFAKGTRGELLSQVVPLGAARTSGGGARGRGGRVKGGGAARSEEVTRGKTRFQIREVDENHWKATVFAPNGRMYVCDYAPGDPDPGMVNEDGSPTLANVVDAWRTHRRAFREV